MSYNLPVDGVPYEEKQTQAGSKYVYHPELGVAEEERTSAVGSRLHWSIVYRTKTNHFYSVQ